MQRTVRLGIACGLGAIVLGLFGLGVGVGGLIENHRQPNCALSR
jgi:hypothetical protein